MKEEVIERIEPQLDLNHARSKVVWSSPVPMPDPAPLFDANTISVNPEIPNGTGSPAQSRPSPTDSLPPREKVKSFPTTPGIYLMKDSVGRVIYIGKAVNLRSRASSYFTKKIGRAHV